MSKINLKKENLDSDGLNPKNLLININKLPETKRRGLILSALKKAGVIKSNGNFYSTLIANQRDDGGWADVLETAFSAFAINKIALWEEQFNQAISWLKGNKNQDIAWGNSSRDIPRITVTGLLLTLLPELADDASLTWLGNEWQRDLNGDTKLTYKGAFTLMAFASTGFTPQNPSLIADTIEYLVYEQNEDGGFAPWKGHPVGSEPWSTGIDLIGLLSFPELVKPEIVEKTLDWLAKNQLPNGLWPCHYIEEGSSYCYWGIVEALKYLKRLNR
jgi:hypothetical protein